MTTPDNPQPTPGHRKPIADSPLRLNALDRHPKLRLGVIMTVLAIVSYALGALTHSEIWHFFLGE